MLENDEKSSKIFVPCGGPDADTDEISHQVEDVKLSLLFEFDINTAPQRKSEGISSSICPGDNWFVTSKKNGIEEGDCIFFHGERAEVYSVSEDFMNVNNNFVHIKGTFQGKHGKQSFKITKMPVLQGQILSVLPEKVRSFRPVKIRLDNIDISNIGMASITYYNFCFNDMGFLTHDTAMNDTVENL